MEMDSAETAPSTAEVSSIEAYKTCNVCHRTFHRVEHLKRHVRSHLGEKPFPCKVCSKPFSRKDSLKRHESKHQATSDNQEPTGFFSVRACWGCMKARVRCSRHDPCRRCATRGMPCTYSTPLITTQLSTNGPLADTAASEPADDHESLQSSPSDSAHDNFTRTATSTQSAVKSAPTVPHAGDPAFSEPGNANPGMSNEMWSSAIDQALAGPHHDRFLPDQIDVPNVPINWLPYIDMPWDSTLDLTHMIQSMHEAPLPAEFGVETASWTDPNIAMNSTSLQADNFDVALTPVERSAVRSGDSWTSSPMAPQEVPRRHGSLYADGQGSRLTRERIPPTPLIPSEEAHGNKSRSDNFTLTELPSLSACIEQKDRWFSLPDQTYSQILERFRMLCVHPVLPTLPPFTNDWFPPSEAFEITTELFFTHFNAYFPIIHKATFCQGYYSWLLILATSAVGCAYAGPTHGTMHNTYALTELLRRALCMEELISTDQRDPMDALMLSQAAMLRCILENFHSTDKIRGKASLPMSTLGFSSTHHAWLGRSNTKQPSWSQDPSQTWLGWVVEEGRRRVAFGLWLFDTHLRSTSHSIQESQLSLSDVPVILPDDQDMWNAESEEEWRDRSIQCPGPKALQTVLFDLYMGRCDLARFGDFNCTILIYAVCARVYDVGNGVKNILHNLDPAERTIHEDRGDQTIWLPAHATYEKWRNSALDCLDSLHWQAHVAAARQCGLEGPVMLHLHLARLVLLCPVTEIYALIEMIAVNRPPDSENRQCEEPLGAIWRWLRQDYYKARLAVIHAGTIFWHIRRYSVRSPFEPNTLFVATLVLWAYSSYATLVCDPAPSRDSTTQLEIQKTPAQFQIDRPCDDELVQAFIRKGDRMQPCMGGVGCIASPKAAPKIVETAKELMSSCCSIWSLARRHRKALSRLHEATSGMAQRGV